MRTRFAFGLAAIIIGGLTAILAACGGGSPTSMLPALTATQGIRAASVPTVTSVSPTALPGDGNAHEIEIKGTGFSASDQLQFLFTEGPGKNVWRGALSPGHVVSSSVITDSLTTTPFSNSYSVRVCDSTRTHCSQAPQTITATALPAPSLSSVSPSELPADGKSHRLTLTGAKFAAGDGVWFLAGEPGPSGPYFEPASPPGIIVSGSKITVDLNPGTVDIDYSVKVCNSATPAACSHALRIPVSRPPVVSGVSPGTLFANGQQQTISVSGSNFLIDDVVQLFWTQPPGNNVWTTDSAKLSYFEGNSFQIAFTPGKVNNTYSLRVCDSTLTACSQAPHTITAVAPTVLAAQSISPTAMPADNQQHLLTINGTGFLAADIVQLNWTQGTGNNTWTTTSATPTLVSGSQLTVEMNPGTVSNTYSVRVCPNRTATYCSQAPQTIAVTATGLPVVSSISPTAMAADNQQHLLTVNGASFKSGNVVQLNWTQGAGNNTWTTTSATPTIVSGSQLTVEMNPGTVSNTYTVRVCSDGTYAHCSQAPQSIAVTYTPPVPSVSSISPTSVSASAGQQLLTINGSNFASGDIVQFFGGNSPSNYSWTNSKATPTIVSGSQITVEFSPPGTASTLPVRVCDSTGTHCSGSKTISILPS